MVMWHGEKGRKPTGGVIHLARKKRKFELGSLSTLTKIGQEKKKIVRTRGGQLKVRAFNVEFANVLDPATKSVKKVKIVDVIENKANPQLVRSKIITKGAVIKTEIGNARVTSRPGQDGVVNAIKIE